MSDSLIQLDNISFAYSNGANIFNKACFELTNNDKIALTGANGSGKTTLLHLIVGLLTPSSGQVFAFAKHRIKEEDFIEVRTKAGLLFQDPDDQLFCPTVREDIAFGPLNLGKSHDEAAAIVNEVLDKLELKNFADKITYRLSGGEKKLVSIAAVLAMKPQVLLLDEPAAGLDKTTEARIIEILKNLNLPMIIVSHDHEFLSQLTNKTFVIKNGIISQT